MVYQLTNITRQGGRVTGDIHDALCGQRRQAGHHRQRARARRIEQYLVVAALQPRLRFQVAGQIGGVKSDVADFIVRCVVPRPRH